MMKKAFFKALKFYITFAFCLLPLCGCAAQEPTDERHLETSPYVIEEQTDAFRNVTIYSYGETTAKLESRIVSVPIYSDQTGAEAALNYLFSLPEFAFAKNSYGIADFELSVSGGIAKVKVVNGCDTSEKNRFKNFAMHFSVVNTLCALSEINYVSVYAGNKEMAGETYIGPSKFLEQDINNYYTEVYGSGSAEGQKPVIIYFGDRSQSFIVPEKHQIYTNTKDVPRTVNAILSEMKKAPTNPADLITVINEDLNLNKAEIKNSRLEIDFDKAPTVESVSNKSITYAALYNSLEQIYPEVNEIMFSVNGSPVEESNITGGIAKEETFTGLVGNSVTLYMPEKELDSLHPVHRYLSASSGISIVQILSALFEGPLEYEGSNFVSPLFEGLSMENLISAKVVNDVAIVNFDTTFYDSVRTMTKEQETALVYSIVNTLTAREQINRVKFLINNQSFETINGHIYYTEPLFANPGMIFG